MITSKTNAFVKEIKSLNDKKYRDELCLYTVEGVKACREALFFLGEAYAIVGTEKGLSELDNLNAERVETLSDEVYKSISNEVTPQGVTAVFRKPVNDLKPPEGSCILLDGVSDPANVGAIIRTAVASGYNDVYLTEGCADPYSPKSVRASMTGVFRINIHCGTRESILKIIDKPIVVGDMKGENAFTFSANKKEREFCLVIGNEGNGVSTVVREHATYTVSIPMQNGMESLNASVSAGILMYALRNNT